MDHRPMIDRLTSLRIEEEEKIQGLNIQEVPEEEAQGLQYKRGEKLLDTTTGKEVIVLAGKRAIGTV